MYLNHSYLNVSDKAQIYDSQDPEQKVNFGFTLSGKKKYLPSYIDLRLNYVGSIQTTVPDSGSTLKTKVHPYYKLDIKVAKKLCKDKLEVSLTGLSLLEPRHDEFGGTVAVDREILAAVKYEF